MASQSIDTKTYILLLENEEYELNMTLFESVIEFKLIPKKSDYIYTEKFDLSTINNRKYLIRDIIDLKRAFEKFDRLLNNKKAKLIKARGDTINLNFKINIIDDEIESNLELKQIKINEEVGYPILKKRIDEMEEKIKELEKKLNKVDIMYEDYLKRKQEEEEKQKKKKLIRQEEEKKLKLNDNVNLINDFQTNNIDMKEIYSISSVYFDHNQNTIAVYPIIRNDERLYELACAKNRNNNYIDIVIYNILLNKKTNVIYHSHVKDEIHNLKHYYYSSEKKHFLLSSNQYEIKLWNISSDIITNELTITPEKNINFNKNNNNSSYSYNYNSNQFIPEYYYYFNCSCLLFNEESYIILGGTGSEIKIFNGNFLSNLSNKQISGVNYIEAAYVEDKSYILLAGNNTQSYDFKDNSLKEYKSKNQNLSSDCIALFNKNNKIYLITSGSDGRVVIFDFNTAEEKGSISVGSKIYGLCSLNKNYFLAGLNNEIKVIDFEKRSVRNYDLSNFDVNDEIKGLEKIKIPDKGEFIISYSKCIITLWKLNNYNDKK